MKEIQNEKSYLGIKEEYFGNMLPYILNDAITDVEWDGQQMKVEDLTKGEYFVETTLTEEFCHVFAKRISDMVNKSYNDSSPRLEAETNTLRITILHPSVTTTGTHINLRKIEAKVRMSDTNVIDTGYCNEKIQRLIRAFMLSRCSGILTGGTGTGKTELLKYASKWIPDIETIVTLEDTNELKLKQIYPHKFVRPCIINRHFTWSDGIEYALRANAKWLLMAEARAQEVLQVLEVASTSLAIVTCIHSKDVRMVPDRIDNMIGAGSNGVMSKENDVFTFFDYAIKVNKESSKGKRPHRYIDQLAVFERKDKVNKIYMIVENGQLTGEMLPESLLRHFQSFSIDNPLKG